MAGSVLWSESAMTDLRCAVEYIAEDSPARARNFAEEALLKADELAVFPARGHVVPELGTPYRELPYKNHRIIYRTQTDRSTGFTASRRSMKNGFSCR